MSLSTGSPSETCRKYAARQLVEAALSWIGIGRRPPSETLAKLSLAPTAAGGDRSPGGTVSDRAAIQRTHAQLSLALTSRSVVASVDRAANRMYFGQLLGALSAEASLHGLQFARAARGLPLSEDVANDFGRAILRAYRHAWFPNLLVEATEEAIDEEFEGGRHKAYLSTFLEALAGKGIRLVQCGSGAANSVDVTKYAQYVAQYGRAAWGIVGARAIVRTLREHRIAVARGLPGDLESLNMSETLGFAQVEAHARFNRPDGGWRDRHSDCRRWLETGEGTLRFATRALRQEGYGVGPGVASSESAEYGTLVRRLGFRMQRLRSHHNFETALGRLRDAVELLGLQLEDRTTSAGLPAEVLRALTLAVCIGHAEARRINLALHEHMERAEQLLSNGFGASYLSDILQALAERGIGIVARVEGAVPGPMTLDDVVRFGFLNMKAAAGPAELFPGAWQATHDLSRFGSVGPAPPGVNALDIGEAQ